MVKTDQIIFATAGGVALLLLAGISKMYYNSHNDKKKKEKIKKTAKKMLSKTVRRSDPSMKTQGKNSSKNNTRKTFPPSVATAKFLLDNPPSKK
jgi:hypothetical protein